MIATSNMNLKVPFNEKDQAKSLGARWNAEAKLWYVPQGVDAAPFEKWVSSAAQLKAGYTAQSDELDAINARLRDAYESNEDAL